MSLAQITREIRFSSKIIGALLVLGFFLFLFFQGGAFIQKVFFPKPPTPPEQKYGALPEIVFPEESTPTPEYRINTVSGQLPTFPDRIAVYPLMQNEASITALKGARDSAFAAGFSENQTSVTPSLYTWNNPITTAVLEMNIISRNFTINSDYLSNPIFATGQTLTSDNSMESVLQLISTLGGNTDDIDISKTKTQNYAILNGTITPVDSFSSGQITKVSLFQNTVNKLPIYYPVFNESTLYFLLTFVGGEIQIPEASYIHKVPNLEDSSTYPLKSATQAFEELKNGEGYIVNPTTDEIVDITDVTLGYYLDNNPEQKYLLPIIVFSGKNDFQAFVLAIP
jgi:hypothetical protein